MRHLMSPLDFSVEELNELLKLAQDIEANTHMPATEKNLRLYSMSQVLVHV